MRKLFVALMLGAFAFAPAARAQDDFKPEPGYVSLFNGKDFSGWFQKGKEKEDLAGKTVTPNKKFAVEGGAIVVTGGGGDIYTIEGFERDFHLKLEFRAAPKADSGLFLRGPQLQVRDYPTVGPYKKLKNFKDKDWNELDITVTGTSALCKCNGETFEEKFKVGQKGGIGLQSESGKFEFRRLRIKVAAAEKPKIEETGARSTPVPAGGGAAKKRLLLITESRGFVHGVVARPTTVLVKGTNIDAFPKMEGLEVRVVKAKDPAKDKDRLAVSYSGRITTPIEIKNNNEVLAVIKPCLVEKTFMELAEKTGLFDVDCSQNSRVELTDENLKKYDAVFFYTTGELPLTDAQKSDLLNFVKKGKGFGGSHCATDTNYKWKEYGEMIGGYFDGHPWNAGTKINVIVEDKKHAATKHLGDSFVITDEIYQFRAPYDRKKLHVLMRLDMDSVKNQGKRADKDNALAWTNEYGKGRVFYTALGHQPEVWNDPRFQQHVIGGLRYLFGMEK